MGCGGCQHKGQSTAVEDTFVGVRFAEETNLTLCRTDGRLFAKDDQVIVDTEDGPSFGKVEKSPMPVFKPCQKSSAKRILRFASDDDLGEYRRQIQNQINAKGFCRRRATELGLEMKVSRVDFTISGLHATY